MSQFIVSARKYRPAQFEDVVGQEHISKTLKNALQTGHLAHAFLFCGPRGVGKTTCARILAKVINCQNAGTTFEPCNTCDSCKAFNENASFNITELDAASNNSVDAMRALIDQVRFQPQQGKYKVFIIDEVHMLSSQAFNAFLKTLEEPPSYAIFILATTEKHKIIPTILSRCQIYDFKRISAQDAAKHLQHICRQEGIEADDAALHIIGQKADGALRDALSIFDRMVAAGGNRITYEAVLENLNVLDYDYYFRFVDGLLSEDLPGVLLLFDEVVRKGFDPDIFILGLAEHLRNLLVCKDEATLSLLEVSDNLRERYRTQAHLAPAALLLSALNLANECDLNYKMARNKRLHTEMSLIKMTYIRRSVRRSPIETAGDPEKKNPDVNEGLAVGGGQSAVGSSNPKPETRNHASVVANPELETRIRPDGQVSANDANFREREGNSESETRNELAVGGEQLQAEIRNSESVGGWRLAVGNEQLQAQIRNSESEIRNQPAPTRKHTVAKLGSLESMLEDQIKVSDQDEAAYAPDMNPESLKKAWMQYADGISSDSSRTFLRQVELSIDHQHITAIVNSALAESTIKQEMGVIEYLRTHFRRSGLTLSIKVEKKAQADDEPTPRATPLNDKEKLRQMQQTNPHLKTLWERLGLGIEGDGG
ncbi:MAG: DNA polymerase III subunit gamma/tau [Saprospiraceae bacterium]|nr:DNA polymerase III subunit gamma/tau [Saprospiraceae bacterium]